MASGSCKRFGDLPRDVAALIEQARRAALATIDDHGSPHVVPVCFAIVADEVVSAVDQKPKSKQELARVHNARARPVATLLFDRWDEDWTRLGWVMASGTVRVAPPGTGAHELEARYPQYAHDRPHGDVLVVSPDSFRWWVWD